MRLTPLYALLCLIAIVTLVGCFLHRPATAGGNDPAMADAQYAINGVKWINSPPMQLSDLKGKVVLVDFWEYTCVNCIRTMPYVKEWWARYKDRGLVIIGVHTPEFDFAKKVENVQAAVKRFGITYPVVVDSEYRTWRAFNNDYWPHHFLFDASGKLQHEQIGEGGYRETELAIQKLLAEAGQPGPWPEPMALVRPTDDTGRACHRITPETYMGYTRGTAGNSGGLRSDKIADYQLPAKLSDDGWALDGPWLSANEYVSPASEGAKLALKYNAAQVYLVAHAALGPAQKLYVAQDGAPISKTAGTDLKADERGGTYILVDASRMYTLVDNGAWGPHELTLTSAGRGLELYSFTFGTSCE